MIPPQLRDVHEKIASNEAVRRLGLRLIDIVTKIFRLDLVLWVYNKRGILNHENSHVSGEDFVVRHWLPKFLDSCAVTSPILFDVGANVGNYVKLLTAAVPNGTVEAFEPYPKTYAALQREVGGNSNVRLWNIAVSDAPGMIELWTEPDHPDAPGHTTLYRDVLTTQFTYSNLVSEKILAETLDSFCRSHGISVVHFLKIDVEGHEMAVLRGAAELLGLKRIYAVQFEFNEMHIISRVFLRDFFQLLEDFNLYRLLPDHLQLVKYSSAEEIFLFQNFLAIRKDLDREEVRS